MDWGRNSIPLLEGSQDSPARPSGNSSTKTNIYKEEEEEVWHGDSRSLKQGPLNFNFSLILKLTICQFNVITLQGIARGLNLTKLNQEGCMRCMHQQLGILGTVAAFAERQGNRDLENGPDIQMYRYVTVVTALLL